MLLKKRYYPPTMKPASEARQNFRRLAKDAKLLIENDRFRSAVLIAILAMEELGKSFVIDWRARNSASKRKHPTHVEKQSAVFCVLAAAEGNKHHHRWERLNASGSLDLHKLGPDSSQLAWARTGFYEDVRVFVTYYDEVPKLPAELLEQIDGELAAEILDYCKRAEVACRKRKLYSLAKEIFVNDLGRL